MSIRYAVTNIPYTLKDIQLGSLIPSIDRPNQDTFGPRLRLKEGKDYKWRNEKNAEFSLAEDGKGSVTASLTKFLQFRGQKSDAVKTTLAAKEGRIYELTEPKTLFRSLVKSKSCKEWLTQAHDEGEVVHYVVGYRTHIETSKQNEITQDRGGAATIQAPIGESLGDPTGLGPSGSALDPKLEVEPSKGMEEKDSSDIEGERIFAICLRRVRFNWFKSKNNPPARLDKDNSWTVTSIRGTDEPDAIEVDLEDSFGKEFDVVAELATEDAVHEFVAIEVVKEDES